MSLLSSGRRGPALSVRSACLSLFLLAGLSACAFDHKKDAEVGTASNLSTTRPVGYNEVLASVLGPKCNGCHGVDGGNQGGINLEKYEPTQALAARIRKSVLEERTMPKKGSLTAQETALLTAWLGQGAPREAGGQPVAQGSAGPVAWPEIRDRVLTRSCFDCHSGPNPEKGLDLTSLAVVRANIEAIFAQSMFTQKMPLAPYPPLSPEERAALAQWFANGMPE